VVEAQLLQGHPCAQHTLVPTAWLQLQAQVAGRQALQLAHVLWQPLQAEYHRAKAKVSWYVDAAHMLAMLAQVPQHTSSLLPPLL
jgi:hypothetical protein